MTKHTLDVSTICELETMDQPEVTWPARCLVPDHRRNDRKTKVRGSGLGMFKFVSKRSQPRGDYSRHCPVRVKGFFCLPLWVDKLLPIACLRQVQ